MFIWKSCVLEVAAGILGELILFSAFGWIIWSMYMYKNFKNLHSWEACFRRWSCDLFQFWSNGHTELIIMGECLQCAHWEYKMGVERVVYWLGSQLGVYSWLLLLIHWIEHVKGVWSFSHQLGSRKGVDYYCWCTEWWKYEFGTFVWFIGWVVQRELTVTVDELSGFLGVEWFILGEQIELGVTKYFISPLVG